MRFSHTPSKMPPPLQGPKQLFAAQRVQAYHLGFPQTGFSSAAQSQGCLGGTRQQNNHPLCCLRDSSPLLDLHTVAALSRRPRAGTARAAEAPRPRCAAARGGGGAAGGRARRPGPRQPVMQVRLRPACPSHRQKPQTPHCVTRRHAVSAPAVLAYLLAASPLRPHRRPPASRALQSEGGRFVRAHEAGQYFAAAAVVPGGRPSEGRDWGPARASFPYVRSQLVQKRGSPGLRRASSPPAGPPPPRQRSPRRHDRPLLPPAKPPPPRLVPRERPARGDSSCPGPGPRRGSPSRSRCGVRPGRAGPCRRRGGGARPPRTPRPRGGGPRERAPRLPRSGAQAPGAAAGTMAAGALRARRRRQRDGRAQRARLPARPRPPGALDAGEEGPGPRGEEEPGRRRPRRGSSSAARGAGGGRGRSAERCPGPRGVRPPTPTETPTAPRLPGTARVAGTRSPVPAWLLHDAGAVASEI